MTKFIGSRSNTNTTNNKRGEMVHAVNNSLISDILLTLVVSITILSVASILKCGNTTIKVRFSNQFLTMIVPLAHLFVRRSKNRSIPLFLILTILISTAFYNIAIQIPALSFGNSGSNKFFLGAILTLYTVFSGVFRFCPMPSASKMDYLAVPAGLHLAAFLLAKTSERTDVPRGIVINMMIVIMLYIVMRQIAVFDDKYYHSIHGFNRPLSILRKQNTKTAVGLVGLFALALGIFMLFPTSTVRSVLTSLLRVILTALFKFFDFLARLFGDSIVEGEGSAIPTLPPLEEGDNPLVNTILIIIAIVMVCVGAVMIYNLIRYSYRRKPAEQVDAVINYDDIVIDNIEDIIPVTSSRRTAHDFGTGHEYKVRKQFYDKTRRAMRKRLPVSSASTPGEIEKVLRAHGEDISSLRKEYENVRYKK